MLKAALRRLTCSSRPTCSSWALLLRSSSYTPSRLQLQQDPQAAVVVTTVCRRAWSSVAPAIHNTGTTTDDETYMSPLQELWDRMEANGPSLSGLTPEQAQEERLVHSKKTLACGVLESVLRFSTTSYGRLLMAPHVHPQEHAVVLRVALEDLPLSTPLERQILAEIVGSRLSEEKGELRLTSNQFGSRIENKRHLVSMLNRIVLSCQRLAGEVTQELDSNSDAQPASN